MFVFVFLRFCVCGGGVVGGLLNYFSSSYGCIVVVNQNQCFALTLIVANIALIGKYFRLNLKVEMKNNVYEK